MNFDENKYKVYTWKNWMMLHWILNPCLVINELIFGQRIPKISLEDKTVNKSTIKRTLVPCPHCDTLHAVRTWSTQNKTAFINWFGLYCTNCGNIIPCLTNVFSFLILIITFPIWGWFRNSLKSRWLKKQPERFKNIDLEKMPNPVDKKSWIKIGLIWGAFMFLIMSVVFPYIERLKITLKTILLGVVIWSIAGLVFGTIMKLFLNAIGKKKLK